MELNIREMLNGNPSRLRYVFRFSTSRVNRPETVAEHSYYVAFYCLLIGRWVEENRCQYLYRQGQGVLEGELGSIHNTSSFTANLLQRALLHDLEEARSGDFPRPFKRSSPQLEAMLGEASLHAFRQVMSALGNIHLDDADKVGPDITTAKASVWKEYCNCWLEAKDPSPQGLILEFADFLAVLSFLMGEGLGSGNHSIQEHVADMDTYFEKFSCSPEYDFIRPLIDQAAVLMKEVFKDGNV